MKQPLVFSSLDEGTKDWLFATQRELEIESIDRGVQRYRDMLAKKKPGATPADLKLISGWMPFIVKGIENDQAQHEKSLAKKKSLSEFEYILCSMDADKLAYITLVTLLHLTQRPDDCALMPTALAVAANVKVQRYLDVMKKTDRDVVRMLSSKRKKLDKTVVMHMKRKMQIANIEWDKATRIRLGLQLIKHAVEYTKIFDVKLLKENGQRGTGGVQSGMGYRTVRHIQLKPAVRTLIEKYHTEMESLNPYGLPMVVPPTEWDVAKPNDGGYLCLKRTMVKGTFESSVNKPSQQLVDAVNLMQNTEWRINKDVASIMLRVWENGGNMAGVPGRELRTLPPKPEGFNPQAKKKSRWKNVPKEQLEEWMSSAEEIYDWNNKTIGARYQMLFKLDVARRFAKYPALYFPYQVDWRGRAYPIPSFVSPQADDTGRALLEFAEPVALGECGFYWLCIHTANLMGHDKAPMNVRLRKVSEICANDLPQTIQNPFDHRWWMDAEDPFKLYAALVDLWNCVRQYGWPKVWTKRGLAGHAPKYESRLPVAIDGSCNGLQHFSAIGLDPVGGAATNLVPSEMPQDIYQQVCDKTVLLIEEDCRNTPDETAPCHRWRGKVKRNTVKRAVMTTPYGVTMQGIMLQFIQDRHTAEVEGRSYTNANYLKHVVYKAVSTVVVAARQYMDWLQEVACLLGKQNIPMEWVTPAGFTVRQQYVTKSRKQVQGTPFGSVDYRVDHVQTIALKAQMNSIAPNVVHSYDASHMCLVILECFNEYGIRSFGPVHDSYATHAGNMDIMASETRHQFFHMHKESLLQELKTYLENKHKIKLPALPERGALDLHGVYASEYFFH